VGDARVAILLVTDIGCNIGCATDKRGCDTAGGEGWSIPPPPMKSAASLLDLDLDPLKEPLKEPPEPPELVRLRNPPLPMPMLDPRPLMNLPILMPPVVPLPPLGSTAPAISASSSSLLPSLLKFNTTGRGNCWTHTPSAGLGMPFFSVGSCSPNIMGRSFTSIGLSFIPTSSSPAVIPHTAASLSASGEVAHDRGGAMR
jgi:hypothetical protein